MLQESTPNRWLYLASDYCACVRDTRALTLRHHLLWYPGTADPGPGDSLLLGFRTGLTFVPLGKFRLQDPSLSGLTRASSRYGRCVAEIPDDQWEEIRRAVEGRSRGAGYAEPRRALVVEPIADFAAEWALVPAGPHESPPSFRFGVSRDEDSSYLEPFDPAVLSAPMLPQQYWP